MLDADCCKVDVVNGPTGFLVNILDVIVTVNYLIGHIDLSTVQQQNADMNLDGVINILDILMIGDLVLED